MKFNAFFILIAFLVMIIPVSISQINAQSEGTMTTVPEPPGNLTATTNLPIILFWNASADPSSQTQVTHYSIERSSDDGRTWDILSGNIDITKPYNHVKAETITYTDSNVMIGNIYDYRVKAHNVIGESIPSNTASATAMIDKSDKIITFGQRAGEKFVPDPISGIYDEVVLTSFEKNYVLTEDDVKDVFGPRWEIIKTENMLNNTHTDMRSSKIILKDATQFFDPIMKKLKLSSIIIEVYQFDYEFEQEEFWYMEEYDKTIFDVALKSGFSQTTGNCFFENSEQGGMSGCSYDDIIIQVTIFDPYMQNYRYNNSDYSENYSNLDNEPTLKIVNKILEKINNSKHRDYAGNLVDVLYDGQTENTINGGMKNTADSNTDDMIDPETALKAGINYFTCKKNDFGIVSVAGEFVNGVGFMNDAKITISITDENENVIVTDSNNFHNIEKYDTRKFVAYVNTDENFHDCSVEITSDDGLLNYKTSLFLN